MSTETPADGRALLGRINPKPREESVQIILSPDLLDRWQALEAAIQESYVADQQNQRLAAGKPSKKTIGLTKELEALQVELEAVAVTFRFRAIDKDTFRDLKAKHPPRPDDRMDQYLGYNREAVDDAMVRVCLVDPVFEDCAKKGCVHDDCGSWQQLVNVINPAEWGELDTACQQANRAVTDAPKSQLPSAIRRLSGSESGSPASTE